MTAQSPRGYGLTPRMRELLVYIQARELCPSYDEMREALGLKSKSPVYSLVTALEERGHIRRIPGCARAIEVLAPIPYEASPLPPIAAGHSFGVVDVPVYRRQNINWRPEILSEEGRKLVAGRGR